MPARVAHRDPVGRAAVANVDRRNRVTEYVLQHPGGDVGSIARALRISRYIVMTDLVHLVSVGRLRVAGDPTKRRYVAHLSHHRAGVIESLGASTRGPSGQ